MSVRHVPTISEPSAHHSDGLCRLSTTSACAALSAVLLWRGFAQEPSPHACHTHARTHARTHTHTHAHARTRTRTHTRTHRKHTPINKEHDQYVSARVFVRAKETLEVSLVASGVVMACDSVPRAPVASVGQGWHRSQRTPAARDGLSLSHRVRQASADAVRAPRAPLPCRRCQCRARHALLSSRARRSIRLVSVNHTRKTETRTACDGRAKWRRAEGCRFRAGRASMRAGRRLLCRCLPRMAHTRPRTHPPHTPRLPTSPAISVSDMPSRVHLDRTSDHATCSAPRTPLPASAARVQQLIPRRARLQSELRPGPLPFHAGDGRGNRRVSKAHHPLRTRSTPSLCAACLNILARDTGQASTRTRPSLVPTDPPPPARPARNLRPQQRRASAQRSCYQGCARAVLSARWAGQARGLAVPTQPALVPDSA
eukprot:3941812-Rhodomonas_salina.2